MYFNGIKNDTNFMPRHQIPMMPRRYTPMPMYVAPYSPPLQPAPFTPQSLPTTEDIDSTEAGDFEIAPGAPVQTDINYTQGYLESKIGEYVKIEFLIGTDLLIDREGILKDVGISYVVLQESGTNDELMADLYSIKFVRIFDQPQQRPYAQTIR